MAAASTSVGALPTRTREPNHRPSTGFSAEASSTSAAEARPVSSDVDVEEDMVDLDSPWVAVAETESRLEEAASAAGARLRVEEAGEEDEIRDNLQRQEDELLALETIYGDDLVEFRSKTELRYFQPMEMEKMEGVLEDVSQLCEMLDTIWAKLPGQEVVYQWVEWIRSSSLPHLGFDNKITLGPNIPTNKGDNRAISRSLSLESVIPSMLSYSSKKGYQVFLEDLHTCMICLNQSKGSNFIKLPCQHLFCVKCMETLCRMHVKDGTLFQLVCPDTKCNVPIPPYLLKRLLGEEEFERWDKLTLEKALDSMSDVVPCPRCAIGCLEDEDSNAQCPKCCYVFCSVCKDPRHPGKLCLTLEEKLQRQQASGRMATRGMVEEMIGVKLLYGDARSCPKCRMTISKTEGCNKVVCSSCGQAFCFLCGKAIIAGYAHFSGRCDLFHQKEKDTTDWQKLMEQLETRNRVRVERQPVGSTVKCPKCRQKIYKDDDKYIFCWACQASYCTLCKKPVQFTGLQSEHWGSTECVKIKF